MVEDLATKYKSKVDITAQFLSQDEVQRRKRASSLELNVLMLGDAQESLYQNLWGGLKLSERTAQIYMFERALTLSDSAYFWYLASSVGYVFMITTLITAVPETDVPTVLQRAQVPEVKTAMGDLLAIDYLGVDIVASRVEMYQRDVKDNKVPFNFLKYLALLEKTKPEHARRIRMQTVQSG